MANHIVIVGGGMSGLAAARIFARDPNNKITIIERSDEFGGLYTSTTSSSGYVFDHGSHTVLNTGVDELDSMMFEDFAPDEWDVISESLKETVFFKGEHTQNTVCPDARKLPAHLYEKGLAEFMNLQPVDQDFKNLEEALLKTYGRTFADHLFRPIIEKFYTGSFTDLHPKMYKDFLPLGRIILCDDFMTRQLKTIPYFDERIAWTDFKHGQSTIKKYFSKTGGVGRWPNLIEAKLQSLGVILKANANIQNLKHDKGQINEVHLENGEILRCDLLVWTIPAISLLQTAGVQPPRGEKPILLNALIYNFVFDQALLKDDHWIFNYDKDMDTFRVTLYPNLTSGLVGPAPHHMTVEVLKNKVPDNLETLYDKIQSELIRMGLISPSTKVIEKFCYQAQGPRPVPTIAFMEAQASQIQLAKETFRNVKLYGRGNGSHFMNPLLREIWFDINGTKSDPALRPIVRAA
jgi:protoporphyrinogen oxidase